MASDLLADLLGLPHVNAAPADPWQATNDPAATLPRDHHDLAHPLDGASADPTAPLQGADNTPAVRDVIVQVARDELHAQFQAIEATLLALLQVQRDEQKRTRRVSEAATIGGGPNGAYVLKTYGHPYMRLFVSSYQSVTVALPGQPSISRQLSPGWNNLDYPDGTRIYRSAGTLAAIFEASDVSTFTPDAVAVAGYVSLSSPPAQTNAGADTSLLFASPVGHWFIQNNTTANVMFDLETAASLGSPLIAAGQMITSDVPLSQLHLFTAAAQNINGTTAGNIVIRGWL